MTLMHTLKRADTRASDGLTSEVSEVVTSVACFRDHLAAVSSRCPGQPAGATSECNNARAPGTSTTSLCTEEAVRVYDSSGGLLAQLGGA
jgi:hypothetical protein